MSTPPWLSPTVGLATGVVNNIIRCVITVLTVACALAVTSRAASANCGLPEFKAVAIPRIEAVEAIPNTAENLLSPDGNKEGRRPTAALAAAYDLTGTDACPEENPQTLAKYRDLYRLWSFGTYVQSYATMLGLIRSGKTNETPACLSPDLGWSRSLAADHWSDLTTAGGPATIYDRMMADEMSKIPHYAHVMQLWEQNAHSLGIVLPKPKTDMLAWVRSIKSQEAIIDAHAPDGLRCKLPSGRLGSGT